MAEEIERKFLVCSDAWRRHAGPGLDCRQAYLTDVVEDDQVRASIRLRIAGERAWLNIKSAELAVRRLEFEYPVPVADAEEMIERLRIGTVLVKTRYRVPDGGHTWEVDVFHGDNEGLVIAEIELPAEDAPYPRPEWLGAEVSHDPRYYNVSLIHHPYRHWGRPPGGG